MAVTVECCERWLAARYEKTSCEQVFQLGRAIALPHLVVGGVKRGYSLDFSR